MTFALALARLAHTDIDAQFTFVKKRSGRTSAERWREALFKRLSTLQSNPEVWPLADEPALADAKVRMFLFRRWRYVYRVLFRLSGQEVQILRVRSAFQDSLGPDDLGA